MEVGEELWQVTLASGGPSYTTYRLQVKVAFAGTSRQSDRDASFALLVSRGSVSTHETLHQLDSATHRRNLLEHAVLLACALLEIVVNAKLVFKVRKVRVQVFSRCSLHLPVSAFLAVHKPFPMSPALMSQVIVRPYRARISSVVKLTVPAAWRTCYDSVDTLSLVTGAGEELTSESLQVRLAKEERLH